MSEQPQDQPQDPKPKPEPRMGWKAVPVGTSADGRTEYRWDEIALRDIRRGDEFVLEVGRPALTAEADADDNGVIAKGLIEFNRPRRCWKAVPVGKSADGRTEYRWDEIAPQDIRSGDKFILMPAGSRFIGDAGVDADGNGVNANGHLDFSL